MFAVERLRRTVGTHVFSFTVPPDVPGFLDVDVEIEAPENYDVLDAPISLHRLIDILFESDNLAPPIAPSAVITMLAPLSASRSLILSLLKPPKTTLCTAPMRAHASMAIARLRDMRHVNKHAVAFFAALALQNIGKHTNLSVKLLVGKHALFTRFPFPNDSRLVPTGSDEMPVEAVLGVTLSLAPTNRSGRTAIANREPWSIFYARAGRQPLSPRTSRAT